MRPASEPVEPGAPLLVGELAKATGKTVRAIHLYEALGLLRPHDRSKGRYRLFSPDAIVRVRWIGKLQGLGFSLSEIQEVVREQEGVTEALVAAEKLRSLYHEKLDETRAKLRDLLALESELAQSLSFLDACDTACTPQVTVDSCLTCERHPVDPRHAPDLVAGAHVQ